MHCTFYFVQKKILFTKTKPSYLLIFAEDNSNLCVNITTNSHTVHFDFTDTLCTTQTHRPTLLHTALSD